MIRSGALGSSFEGVTMFTYSFGTGIGDQQIMKKMACMTSGVWTAVPDGGDIENAMADYYQVYAAGVHSGDARWVEYEDALTLTRLVAACYSVYDTSGSGRELYGVVCVDLNMIINLGEFRDKPGYEATWAEMRRAAQSCSVISVSEEMLQDIRTRGTPGGGCRECDYEPDEDCPVLPELDSRASLSVAPWRITGLAPILAFIVLLQEVKFY